MLRMGRGTWHLARRGYRGIGDLMRSAAMHMPGNLPAVARVWSVWGRDTRKFALIHPERTFLYASVPKSANTTIKRLLWRLLGVEISGPAIQQTLHRSSGPYAALPDLSFDEREPVLRGEGVFRFSFVRNPYDRLRSAYLQKIHRPAGFEKRDHYLTSLNWRGGDLPSFSDFVHLVARQSDVDMNIHWKPQHRCLVIGHVHYDFIGRVETFDSDIQAVLQRIGAPMSLYEPSISVNRRADELQDRAIYTPDLARLVSQRYHRDFELFGYDVESYRTGSSE